MLKPSYTSCNGFLLPKDFSHDAFLSILNYKPEATDTFIVTYPKCGTTWTQYIVWLLEHDGEDLPPEKSMMKEVPHIEEEGQSIVLKLPNPRFLKSHLPFSLIPYSSNAKYIYVARNPFDCVVSFFYHTKGFVKNYNFDEGNFDTFFDCFLAGEVDFGDYFDNLSSWYEHKNDKNVLFLTYEGLKANCHDEIIRIAKFLGEKYYHKVQQEDFLKKVLEKSSFANMSRYQNRWCTQRKADAPPFIRKGIVGDWEIHLSDHQIKRLSTKFIDRTKGTDIADLWKNTIPVKL